MVRLVNYGYPYVVRFQYGCQRRAALLGVLLYLITENHCPEPDMAFKSVIVLLW